MRAIVEDLFEEVSHVDYLMIWACPVHSA
jgi:hypothetical protein